MRHRRPAALAALMLLWPASAIALSHPVRASHGMVAAEEAQAAQVGLAVLKDGGTAVDAAVAAAFALAVVLPQAGNIGGGGFLLLRPAAGEPAAYDFREMAPGGARPDMWLQEGRYDKDRHHESHLAVGVPGTVAGLHLAWKESGRLPWKRLLEPAVRLARDGFPVSDALARSLREVLPEMKRYPAAVAAFTRDGVLYAAGDVLRQPDLARTLERIAEQGPAGFYQGETAALIEKEMKAGGGLITRADLLAYRARRRTPLRGSYRGYDILTMPPPSAGGLQLLEALNIVEGDDLRASGFGSAATVHLLAEAMRRAAADRARYLGDPDVVTDLPVPRLQSKDYARTLRKGIVGDRASVSDPGAFEWPAESGQTTHVSVVDAAGNAVALTTTLEDNYGSKIVVPGAGFLLNNEMGDFNAGPGLTTAEGLIGTEPNLAGPGKRMVSSMTPTIVTRDGQPFLVLGSPGGRKIPSAVLLTLVNVIDFGMNVQEAIDAPRFHHQWLPDRILHEKWGLSPDTRALLAARGHRLSDEWPADSPTCVQAIQRDVPGGGWLGGSDRRAANGAAVGY